MLAVHGVHRTERANHPAGLGEALRTAAGLPAKMPGFPPLQSSAFLSTPDIVWWYSGVAMMTP